MADEDEEFTNEDADGDDDEAIDDDGIGEPAADSEEDDNEASDDSEDEEPEESGVEDDALNTRLAALETEAQQRQGHVSDLNRAIHGYRQEIKALKSTKKDDVVDFSDAQITKILDEHKDDPAVLLQVFKQVSKQQTAGLKDDAVAETEITQQRGYFDNYLNQTWPQLQDEGSQHFQELQQAKKHMRVEDHPYGNYMAMGSVMLQRMPQLLKDAREEGRNEALKVRSEKQRKAKIKGKRLEGTGKRSPASAGVSDSIKATAKTIGLTTDKQIAIYAKMLKNADSGSISAEG